MPIRQRLAALAAARRAIYFTYMGEFYRTDPATWDKLTVWVAREQSVPHLFAPPWAAVVRKLAARPRGVSVQNIEPEPRRQNTSYR